VKCFCPNAIPFHVADWKYFKEALLAVAACDPSYTRSDRKMLSNIPLMLDKQDVVGGVAYLKSYRSICDAMLVGDRRTSTV
jgi:hypothetical protein